MTTKITNGKVILRDSVIQADVYFENGKITAVTTDSLPFDECIDANGNYVSPGFIDIHVHGGAGFEYIDATEEAIIGATNVHAIHGTTTIFPTLSAATTEVMEQALAALEKYQSSPKIIANIGGVHLEGPYFSPAQSGAQETDKMRAPQKEEYMHIINRYGKLVSRWSYAPEIDEGVEFTKALKQNGIVAAAGHTDAKYDEFKPAYENGCKLITHLYSCTSTITREQGFRKLGIIEAAYLHDDISVETIADGCHLPPELLKLIYKLKGSDAMCLVTDSIRYGSMTTEDVASCKVKERYVIEDGVAKLPDRTAFAGSIATTDVLVRTCVKKADISLCEAVKMMTYVPAKLMNLNTKGSLESGFDADILIFDDNINMKKVIVGGKVCDAL